MLDPCANAQLAVVPSLLGPLQALMLVLPQILLALALAVNSLASPMAWREGIARLLSVIRRRPLPFLGYTLLASSLLCLLSWTLTPTGSSTTALDGPVAQGDWSTFHANPARTGKGDLIEVAREPDLIWKFHDSLILERLPFACSPAVAGGRVLIGGDNQKLYCLSVEDGSSLWTFEAKAGIFSSPAVWDGRVYLGEGLHYDTGCRLYCLDLNTGRELWSFPTTSHTESSPAIHDGRVYFGAGEDGVYCCDALTGEKIWNDRQGHVDCAPLVVEGRVYYGSGYKWQGIICTDAKTGKEVWKKELPIPSWGAPSYSEGQLYVSLGNGNFNESDARPSGEVRCLEASTGNELWRFSGVTDGVHSSVVVQDGRAVFGSRDGGCYALNAETGVLLWRGDIGAPILSSPALAGNYVFFGADDGVFRCLDLNDGCELWSYDTSADVLTFVNEDGRIQSSPAIAQSRIVFGAANGNVYCLGGDAPSKPVLAQTRFRSPLMRAADGAIVELLCVFAGLTGSHGIAIVLTALAFKLVLLPLDWTQARQIWRTQQAIPVLEHMRRDYTDYRVHRFEVRHLLAARGIKPMLTLGCVVVQVPLFLMVFMVLFGTSVLAGQSFLWISDVSHSDRFAQIPAIPWLGSNLNLLPLVLVLSIWILLQTLPTSGQRVGLIHHSVWILVAIGLGLLTYKWPAILLLFTLALLWFGILFQRILLRVAARVETV